MVKTNNLIMKNHTVLGKFSFSIISTFFVAFVLFSCTGQKGEDGKDGMLATRSAIFDSSPSSWAGDTNSFTTSLSMPEITDDIFYNGSVLVYRLFEDNPKSFNLLPYTYVYNNITNYMDFDVYVGKIEIHMRDILDSKNITQAPSSKITFKVIIIQGMAYATLKKQVDITNFKAVSSFLGIEKSNVSTKIISY